jgi:hypothetical protein
MPLHKGEAEFEADIEALLDEYDAWVAACEESEYTDTGQAWEFLGAMASLLEEYIGRPINGRTA